MPAYYLDSSALVKRYVTETGSAWVRELCQDAANAIFISELALVEVGSAFARRYHRGEITDEQRRHYLGVFVYDCAESYHLIPAERPTIERGLDLTQQHTLRGYDALQLASRWQPTTYWPSLLCQRSRSCRQTTAWSARPSPNG